MVAARRPALCLRRSAGSRISGSRGEPGGRPLAGMIGSHVDLGSAGCEAVGERAPAPPGGFEVAGFGAGVDRDLRAAADGDRVFQAEFALCRAGRDYEVGTPTTAAPRPGCYRVFRGTSRVIYRCAVRQGARALDWTGKGLAVPAIRVVCGGVWTRRSACGLDFRGWSSSVMCGLAVARAARVTGPRRELGQTVWLVGPGRALREEDA
jgi:hypothetical protein